MQRWTGTKSSAGYESDCSAVSRSKWITALNTDKAISSAGNENKVNPPKAKEGQVRGGNKKNCQTKKDMTSLICVANVLLTEHNQRYPSRASRTPAQHPLVGEMEYTETFEGVNYRDFQIVNDEKDQPTKLFYVKIPKEAAAVFTGEM